MASFDCSRQSFVRFFGVDSRCVKKTGTNQNDFMWLLILWHKCCLLTCTKPDTFCSVDQGRAALPVHMFLLKFILED